MAVVPAKPRAADRLGPTLTGAVWMLGAVVSFTLMGVAGKELAGVHNSFEIMFWRSLVGAAIVSGFLARSAQGFAQLRTRRGGLHLVRNLFHFTGQNCWFYAITVLPLAQVFALEFTSPIWVALLAPLVLGERFTAWRMLAAGLGFVGILIVLRPDAGSVTYGHAVALAASFGFAGNILATKILSRNDSILCILFWMTVSQAAMALACVTVISPGGAPPWPEAHGALWLAVVGVCGLTAHFSVTKALSLADASVMAPLEFLRLPAIAVVAALLFGQPLEWAVFVGGAVIFAGNVVNIRAARAPKREG